MQGHGSNAPPIFRGELPQLEAFTSQYCTTLPLGNYATLTSAKLRNHNRRVTLMSLLNALKGCAMLERLVLEGYSGLEQGAPHLTPIHLPRLQQLDLLSSDSALILEHLEVPSLRAQVVIFDSSPQRDILHSLPTTQHDAPYLGGITSLMIDLNTRSLHHYIAGFRDEGLTAFYIGVHDMPYWAKGGWTQSSFTAVASFAPFYNIHTLTLVTNALAVPWELWLPNLNRVEELTVSCPRPDGLLAALLSSFHDLRLPLLHSLTLYRRGRYAIVDHTNLMVFVLYRYGAGRPLRQLRLNRDEWGLIQHLDERWVLLAQSQCKFFRLIPREAR